MKGIEMSNETVDLSSEFDVIPEYRPGGGGGQPQKRIDWVKIPINSILKIRLTRDRDGLPFIAVPLNRALRVFGVRPMPHPVASLDVFRASSDPKINKYLESMPWDLEIKNYEKHNDPVAELCKRLQKGGFKERVKPFYPQDRMYVLIWNIKESKFQIFDMSKGCFEALRRCVTGLTIDGDKIPGTAPTAYENDETGINLTVHRTSSTDYQFSPIGKPCPHPAGEGLNTLLDEDVNCLGYVAARRAVRFTQKAAQLLQQHSSDCALVGYTAESVGLTDEQVAQALMTRGLGNAASEEV